MKIAVDYSPVQSKPAGIGQYTTNLISKLLDIDKKNEYIIYTQSPVLLSNAKNYVIKPGNFLVFRGLFWMLKVSRHAKKHNVDIFISTSNHLFSILFPKTIQFIHDLAPIRYPKFFSRKFSILYKITTNIVIKKAYKVITISSTIKEELIKIFKTNRSIYVINPALNKWLNFDISNTDEIGVKYNLPAKYLLSVSTLEPRKNITVLIKAFAKFKSKNNNEIKLVIVGKKGWMFKEIFEIVNELNMQNDIFFLGYVPNEDLSGIYKNASGFIYLSFYEGFGIPPLEALYFNLPTLLSNISVFQETFHDLAYFTDVQDIDIIANDIKTLINTPKKDTKSIVEKQFSWLNSASQLLKIINESN